MEGGKRKRKADWVVIFVLQNVMYLMIVNMPSDEELATAKREMEEEKQKKKAKGDGTAPSEQA